MFSTGLSVKDRKLVISSNPVSEVSEREGVVAFKTPLWVVTGTEMRTHHLPAH